MRCGAVLHRSEELAQMDLRTLASQAAAYRAENITELPVARPLPGMLQFQQVQPLSLLQLSMDQSCARFCRPKGDGSR